MTDLNRLHDETHDDPHAEPSASGGREVTEATEAPDTTPESTPEPRMATGRADEDLTDGEIAITDFGTYTTDQFFDDMFRVTRFRTDPELCDRLVNRSFETLQWLRGKGVRFAPIYGRQAFKIDGRFKFWGGLTVEAWGGGPGLVEALTGAARKNGIDIWYTARATALIH